MTLSDWRSMRVISDDGPIARASIGLITLASDVVIERELARMMPVEGVGVFASRIAIDGDLTVDGLARLEAGIPAAARLLLPEERLDAIAFGCTSGTIAIGAERVAAAIHAVRPGIVTVDPFSAALAAFAALGLKRVALLTPYPDAVSESIRRALEAHGVRVPVCGTFRQTHDPTICRVAPQAILEAAGALGETDVDGVFISCTALRVSSVLSAIEARIGKPVIASNQALAWDLLRRTGIADPVSGFGRLLESIRTAS
jgi:maleate isomerase